MQHMIFSEGGLLVAIAEMLFENPELGAELASIL
jgi:phosphoribosylformylglycinamidine (FGAM) synthase-like enzyme